MGDHEAEDKQAWSLLPTIASLSHACSLHVATQDSPIHVRVYPLQWMGGKRACQRLAWHLTLAHYRYDEILLIDTGFKICHVCFRLSTPHKSNFKALFSSRNRLRTLNEAIVLLAGHCHVGHKNANRPHAHGSACTLVAATQDIKP